MKITEMVPVTAEKSRIVTEDQFSFVLYNKEAARYHLEVGAELSDSAFSCLQKEVLVPRARLRAMHLLNRMDYTEEQLRAKLRSGGYPEGAVEEAVAYVKNFHYLDDGRYAAHYLESQKGKKSRRQILYELEQKGICREQIPLDSEEGEETGLILKLLEKRCRQPETADRKEKERHFGYFVRKGFRMEDIRKAFGIFFERFP